MRKPTRTAEICQGTRQNIGGVKGLEEGIGHYIMPNDSWANRDEVPDAVLTDCLAMHEALQSVRGIV